MLIASQLGDKYGDILKNRRPFKMQIRTTAKSTKEPHAARARRTTSQTGVAASRKNYQPQSTNVSSPVNGTRRRNKQKPARVVHSVSDDEEDNCDTHSSDDGFIVPDDVFDDDDEFGMGPIREGTRSITRGNLAPRIGPPITNDTRVDEADLNDIHRALLDEFVTEAKKVQADILISKDLRNTLFTDLQLREMAIKWTTSTREMSAIPGINQDNVRKHGSRLIALVKTYFAHYEDMMSEQNDDRDIDQNHQNVIDISDDDLEDDMSEDGVSSGYFGQGNTATQLPKHLDEFNKALRRPTEKTTPQRFQERDSMVLRADTPPPRPSERATRGKGGARGGSRFSGSQRKKSNTGEGSARSRSRAPSGSLSRAQNTKSRPSNKLGESFGVSKSGSTGPMMKQFEASNYSKSKSGGAKSTVMSKFLAMPS